MGSAAMNAIVGLGNPGPEYRETRHNVGFAVADLLCERRGPGQAWRSQGDVAYLRTPEYFIVKPLSFMNRSGVALQQFVQFFKIEPGDVLIVVDDIDLPLGRIRARASGSAGTHNGLRSIVQQLGTTEFPRLRLGVGRGDARRNLADHVLSKFDPAERPKVDELVTRAADAAEMFATEGILKVMNTYNADPVEPQPD